MIRSILLSALLLGTAAILQGQNADLNDGPYLFIEEGALIEKRIVNGEVLTNRLEPEIYPTEFTPDQAAFKDIDTLAVLSDIHGQYDLAVELLTNNGVIDADGNWDFGTGHLVVVGDIFDRGDKVNEALWLIYQLEQQAKASGGGVHFTLGNHEFMVLLHDLRYVHKKYDATCELLDLEYPELYGTNTVMGRWLRSRNTVLRINDNLYVHGGLSKKFLDRTDLPIDSINSIMRASIDRSKEDMKSTDHYKTYFGGKGPIWYRGYFEDELKDKKVSAILERTNSEHIIVGHCSNETIVHLYDHKIYGVDSSIKKGEYGELLLIEGDTYRRMTLEGEKKSVPAYQFVEDD